jgi:CsoR family transcriptional regulator, copper-sensing transcriptional repressor
VSRARGTRQAGKPPHDRQSAALPNGEPPHDHESETPPGSERPHRHESPHHQTQAVLNRLARTEGHIRAVRRMVEEGRDCPDVLIQLAAIRAAVDKVARVVLEDHIESCLREAVANGTAESEWRSLKGALDRYLS